MNLTNYLLIFILCVGIDANELEVNQPIDRSNEKCNKKALNGFLETLTPQDYEEAKLTDIYIRAKSFNQTFDKFERLQTFQQNISKSFEPILKRIIGRMTEVLIEIQLPNECMTALLKIASGVQTRKSWALNYMETLPDTKSSDSYDECLEFKIPEYELNSVEEMVGQYCQLALPDLLGNDKIVLNDSQIALINEYALNNTKNYHKKYPHFRMRTMSFTHAFQDEIFEINNFMKTVDSKLPIGICIPKTCKPQDIENALNKVIYPITRLPIVINPDCDYKGKPITFNKYQLLAITTFTILFILVLFSTLYELIRMISKKQNKSSLDLLMQSFSGISNFKQIFFAPKPENNKFQILDGIRAILTIMVVLIHSIMMGAIPFGSKQSNRSATFQLANKKSYILLKNIHLIDTFFFIGGMMVCYIMLSKLERSKGRFNYLQYAVFRYIRVIPVTIAAIFIIFLFPLVGSGPNWHILSTFVSLTCQNDWLSSILMKNNFDVDPPHKGLCNAASWYIAADYHLYLLAPIIFLLYHHLSKFAYIWSLLFIILGVIIAVLPKVVWNIPYILEDTGFTDTLYVSKDVLIVYYWRADPHIVSYVFGMFCGFLIRQKPNIYFGGRVGEIFIWIITSTMTGAGMYWCNYFWDYYHPISYWEVVSFLAFSKLSYLSGWFWLCYACATGRGGFVTKFFSWRGFNSFSNLSFEVSMLHTLPLFYRVGVSRTDVTHTLYYVITNTCFDYLMTFLLSIVVNLLVTAPFANLVDYSLKPRPRSTPHISPKENETNQ